MNNFSDYYKAVSFLEGLSNTLLKNDYLKNRKHPEIYIKRMRYFLDLIGKPDKNFKFIHITGTSGKGTVTNMVHNIIMVSGKRVGSFTSPFVTSSIEKIKVNDQYINPKDFVAIVDYLKPYIDKAHKDGPYGAPSYFEIFLAVALIYFKKEKCQWVVLEVGLGGRYDATNVISKSVVSAITNIDFDHTHILGKTLKKIANDKAGIIKKDSFFITTEQRPTILKIFKNICFENKVDFLFLGKEKDYFSYNKSLASAISKRIGIENSYIKKGIDKSFLPCRFETINKKPTIVLDGAHNRSKMKATVMNIKRLGFNKLHLVLAIAKNKDHLSILKDIIPMVNTVSYTRFEIPGRQCADPKELLVKSKKYLKKGAKFDIFLDPEMALDNAIKKSKANDLVLVTGSFFLAGELRKRWYNEDWILRNRKSA